MVYPSDLPTRVAQAGDPPGPDTGDDTDDRDDTDDMDSETQVATEPDPVEQAKIEEMVMKREPTTDDRTTIKKSDFMYTEPSTQAIVEAIDRPREGAAIRRS